MKVIFLGTKIFRDKISNTLVNKINEDMDKQIETNKSISAVNDLSGKVEKEYKVNNLEELDKNKEIRKIIQMCVDETPMSFYTSKKKLLEVKIDQAWINDQKENEYQICHIHSGESFIGYSSILYLRVPDFGKEYTHNENPMNGRTDLIGSSTGMFTTNSHTIHPKVGDFYVFPYDLRHVVYPFIGSGIRRTMSINFDFIFEK
tara:strand:+ start:590 stop:1198 length:609 start_codon:yes stop_codon:yes gene_type:complete